MIKNFLKGIQIGIGFILVIGLVLCLVWASGWHSANEILEGTFAIGTYSFNGSNVNFTGATVTGLSSTGIEKTDSSVCTLSNEGDMRYNPTTYSYEGCFANSWETIKNIGCDYQINGNCWKLIWTAKSNDYNSNSFTYDNNEVVSLATGFGFVFLDSEDKIIQGYYTTDSGVLTDLKTDHLLNYHYVDRSVTMYDINTDSSSTGTFKYGYASFDSYYCTNGWRTAEKYGRICYTGASTFPFYSRYYLSGTDYCSSSNEAHSTTSCSEDKKFAILVKLN